jgi:hypothetical protein
LKYLFIKYWFQRFLHSLSLWGRHRHSFIFSGSYISGSDIGQEVNHLLDNDLAELQSITNHYLINILFVINWLILQTNCSQKLDHMFSYHHLICLLFKLQSFALIVLLINYLINNLCFVYCSTLLSLLSLILCYCL